MTFATFLDRNFGQNANSDGTHELLNVPGSYLFDKIWSNPLKKLKADIPVPQCLASRSANITSVNMWMSNALLEGKETTEAVPYCGGCGVLTFRSLFARICLCVCVCTGSSLISRLHMDPLDSLYVVVGGSGRTSFRLHSPDQAAAASSSSSSSSPTPPAVRTISPTYGVSPAGFSFQYNSPADLPSLDSTHVQGHELGQGHYHFSSWLPSESPEGQDRGSVVELQAGDLLFVPAGWYYEVSCLHALLTFSVTTLFC